MLRRRFAARWGLLISPLRCYEFEKLKMACYVAIALLVVGFALWQLLQDRHARSKLSSVRSDSCSTTSDLIHDILKSVIAEYEAGVGSGKSWAGRVDCLDVDGDGSSEVLVQFPSGVHGCALQIFGTKANHLGKLGQIGSGAPVGFDFGDFDGDGKIEIRSEEVGLSSGLPYVEAPRFVVLWRWDGVKFSRVS